MKRPVPFLAWTCLALVVTTRAAPAAETPARTAAAAASSVDDATTESRRLLRLASGQTIRVVSRQVDGRWEYKNKSGWKALEPGAVTRVELERDVLREWNARRSRVDLRSPAARAELAEYGAAHGLAAEALAELEGVLAVEPDLPAALATLRSHWFFTVPTIRVEADALKRAEEDLLRFGAAQTAAGRELAAAELAHHPDPAALETRLQVELASNVVARRAFAALALRRLYPHGDARALLVRSVLDASDDVRRGCALALKAAQDPALCLPVVRALESRSPRVRARAAEALGHMGYPAAVEPLVAVLKPVPAGGSGGVHLPRAVIFVGKQTAYVQDFDVEVAAFQSVADPQVNVYQEGMSTEAAVAGVYEVDFAVETTAVDRALSRLTGADPGHTARAWLDWWEKNGATWRQTHDASPAGSAPTRR